MKYRQESDSMGAMQVPESALYGAQTRRAELNFPISGWTLPRPFLMALARLKRAAAVANRDLGRLAPETAELIVKAADEIIAGGHSDQFPLDIFQTGSATSTNMNMNEVLANRAIQLAGGVVGSKKPVHPNDHVNLGQSSNDLTPTAAHIAAALQVTERLLPALEKLKMELLAKVPAFEKAVKIGRTHLQDAVPIRMGQVFTGFAGQSDGAIRRVEQARDGLFQLAMGGTAVGTGLNCHPDFPGMVIEQIARDTGLPFVETDNHFSAQASMDDFAALAGALKSVALALIKMANDIRFLASGPRSGLGELSLPELQPGSSIMPGKVNPVVCEALMQASAFAVSADAGVAYAVAVLSNFELAVAWPYAVWHVLEANRVLSAAIDVFREKVVMGLEVNFARCRDLCEQSLAMCTSLAPEIGYDKAAAIAKAASERGLTVREVAREMSGLSEADLDRLLDPGAMTGRG